MEVRIFKVWVTVLFYPINRINAPIFIMMLNIMHRLVKGVTRKFNLPPPISPMKWLVLIMFLSLIAFLIELSSGDTGTAATPISVGNHTYSVEIADAFGERQTGLMHRQSLPEGQGMLFIFPDEDYHSFWMKDTPIPLDIIFVSSDFRVVDVTSLEPCAAACEPYTPKEKAMFVLEVNKDSGIKEGEAVFINWQ